MIGTFNTMHSTNKAANNKLHDDIKCKKPQHYLLLVEIRFSVHDRYLCNGDHCPSTMTFPRLMTALPPTLCNPHRAYIYPKAVATVLPGKVFGGVCVCLYNCPFLHMASQKVGWLVFNGAFNPI